jgi:EAL domain-containing protein (putative c-di-GMP-specific phosphodiesterase class I)/ActR/RegA family two-component response regulator
MAAFGAFQLSSLPTSATSRIVGGRCAFVLDDEVAVGKLICGALVACGFVPRQFTSPIPFLADVKLSPPELVVLDLSLGQSDAVEVIRHLEIVKYRGNVLLVSGRDEATLVETARIGERHGLAMLPPLRKPFRANDLKGRLADLERDLRPRKDKGRSEPPQPKAGRQISVDLGEALRNDWLRLWYQPKIDLKSLSVSGAEALLRAEHPEHGILTPADLLPPPGDPLYHPMSRFVIARALADWTCFAGRQLPLKLAVNVPVSVVAAPGFIGLVRGLLPTDPNFPGLIIEVTEDEMIRDPESMREIATQLKLYNVWISIDDFGSGYASLSRLSDLPFIEVKIDRGFVSNCSSDWLKHALCQAAIDVAHRFGASVCAEGVETAEDLRSLVNLGCDAAQGFLFARPMPADKLAKMLLAQPGESSQARSAMDSGNEPRLAAVAS